MALPPRHHDPAQERQQLAKALHHSEAFMTHVKRTPEQWLQTLAQIENEEALLVLRALLEEEEAGYEAIRNRYS